jgi:hypothetical protein
MLGNEYLHDEILGAIPGGFQSHRFILDGKCDGREDQSQIRSRHFVDLLILCHSVEVLHERFERSLIDCGQTT